MISLFMRVTVNRWNSGVAVNMSPCHGEDRGFDSRLFRQQICKCSSMVELQPSKLITRVRFPSLAPSKRNAREIEFFCICQSKRKRLTDSNQRTSCNKVKAGGTKAYVKIQHLGKKRFGMSSEPFFWNLF